MRLSAPWIAAAHVQRVLALLTGAGHRGLLVGGCVRNGLLGAEVSDIDIATDALPARVVELARAAGIRCVPTGIEHGTVTLIAEGLPHEVTTFRRDVETDGRRATVAFSERLEEDAARRDFTMNALYAEADGTVLDPLGLGLGDLTQRRLRFVGDPAERIREDYLRILRFFRFTAWYGDPAQGMEPEGLAACAALAEGIDTLSRERIWHEMRKLLAAPDPAPAVAAMAAAGVLAHVVPGADPRALAPLVHLEAGAAPDPLRRLAALGGDAGGLRLSKAEARRLQALRDAALSGDGAELLGYRLGQADGTDAALIRAALAGTAPEPAQRIAFGAAQRLPVTAADLMPALSGPALGAALRAIEARWIASGFRLSRDELLR